MTYISFILELIEYIVNKRAIQGKRYIESNGFTSDVQTSKYQVKTHSISHMKSHMKSLCVFCC